MRKTIWELMDYIWENQEVIITTATRTGYKELFRGEIADVPPLYVERPVRTISADDGYLYIDV